MLKLMYCKLKRSRRMSELLCGCVALNAEYGGLVDHRGILRLRGACNPRIVSLSHFRLVPLYIPLLGWIEYPCFKGTLLRPKVAPLRRCICPGFVASFTVIMYMSSTLFIHPRSTLGPNECLVFVPLQSLRFEMVAQSRRK
jgi:hypothetical protein